MLYQVYCSITLGLLNSCLFYYIFNLFLVLKVEALRVSYLSHALSCPCRANRYCAVLLRAVPILVAKLPAVPRGGNTCHIFLPLRAVPCRAVPCRAPKGQEGARRGKKGQEGARRCGARGKGEGRSCSAP